MKNLLIQKVIAHLQKELTVLLQAAENAHLAAIDEQSIAETQYDTLAIEASYLAEGQSKRGLELRQSIAQFKNLAIKSDYPRIALGALVHLAQDSGKNYWLFIVPAAAGFRTIVNDQEITFVTPNAPLGNALMGKQLEAEVELKLANQDLTITVLQIK